MELVEKINEMIGPMGRMISGSKSGYRNVHPDNLVMFNGNICINQGEPTKVWYGDIDITKSRNQLREIAVEMNTDLYVLYEMDARFENEERPLIKEFVYRANADGTEEISEIYRNYYHIIDNQIKAKPNVR